MTELVVIVRKNKLVKFSRTLTRIKTIASRSAPSTEATLSASSEPCASFLVVAAAAAHLCFCARHAPHWPFPWPPHASRADRPKTRRDVLLACIRLTASVSDNRQHSKLLCHVARCSFLVHSTCLWYYATRVICFLRPCRNATGPLCVYMCGSCIISLTLL